MNGTGTLTAVANCPAGTLAIGGGHQGFLEGQSVPAADLAVQQATPLDDFSGYRVTAYHAPERWTLQATALCVSAQVP